MSLKDELIELTLGADSQIQITPDILKDLSWSFQNIRDKGILVSKAEYGFWVWADPQHETKLICWPGEYVVIDETQISFKTQEEFDLLGIGPIKYPSLSEVILL